MTSDACPTPTPGASPAEPGEPPEPLESREIIDWAAAAELAARIAPPGPRATGAELDDLVTGLRDAASDAVEHVLTTTRMTPAAGAGQVRRVFGGPRDGAAELGTVHVVDRARWALANTQVMAVMTGPVASSLDQATTAAARLGGGIEVGGVLALLAPRVLGQFDPYAQLGPRAQPGAGTPHRAGPGRLLLVAPNVLQAERAMGVNPRDFRLWVCLHEQTHALQFASAPWLAPYLRDRVGGLLADVTTTAVDLADAPLHRKLATAGRTVAGVVSGMLQPGRAALFERMLTPEQKDGLAGITAVMALLEGHADVMMDAVGPRVVRSVRQIRRSFERRRDGEGSPGLDVVLRRLLGMEAKLAQYRDGAAFVRAVEDQVGRDGLNAVWSSPGALPTAREIADAPAWVRRVHG